jgi:two-component sensor histidine kinase
MATSQDLVTASGGGPVRLADVVRQTLTPFGLARFDIDEALPAVTIEGEVAIGLALLLHEMATNAVKYGALSNAQGRVAIARSDAAERQAAIAWTERGGPEMAPATRQGFGTRLLESALRGQGGTVEFSFERTGFQARLRFPIAT